MKRIIFLDFDGVIAWTLRARQTAVENDRPQQHELDPHCLAVLDKILSFDKNIMIVISSAWRHLHSLADLKQMFIDYGFPRRAEKTIDVTPTLRAYRQHEIDAWLKSKEMNLCRDWVALDDCDDIIGYRLVQTDMDIGLTDGHVDKIMETLYNERRQLSMRDPNVEKAREVLHALIDKKRSERKLV